MTRHNETTTIYLDTNKWIDLEASTRDGNAMIQSVLATARSEIGSGRWRFPLSFAHWHEIMKMKDPGKRTRLWEFAICLSRRTGLLLKECLLDRLIDDSVRKVFGLAVNHSRICPFTDSVLFGMSFPESAPIFELRARTEEGWRNIWLSLPEDTRAALFQGMKRLESSFLHRGRFLRDKFRKESTDTRERVYIAQLLVDYRPSYERSLQAIKKDLRDLDSLSMEDKVRRVTGVSPLDVEVAMASEHVKQWDRQEQENDIRDFRHLCMAVPYCDVVVTEKYWVDKLRRRNLHTKYETTLLTDLDGLLQLRASKN